MPALVGSLTIQYPTGQVEIAVLASRYSHGGRIQVRLEAPNGDPWGTLTVNLPDVPLAQNEILVKTWSENKFLRSPALRCGLFEDTGRRVPNGFVEAEVWRFTGKLPDVH